MIRRILFLVTISCIHLSIMAQNDPLNYANIVSPTAASLGKYADFPISYHTGLTNIDIPIYKINNGSLELPISLSYHAGGLKVLETAGWVGHGWSLSGAGGVISRIVRGGADDRGFGAATTQYGHFHDYGYNSYLHEVGGPACGSPACPTGAPRHADDMAIMAGTKDGEPDLYTFNFGGYSGKFYFRDDRTPVLMPQQDIKIEPILTDESSTVAYIFMPGFKLTTPDGTKYYFGKNQEADGNIDALEATYTFTGYNSNVTNQGAVSSWFLNKIESADNLFSIKLVYEVDQSSNYTLSMLTVSNTPPIVSSPDQFANYYGGNKEYDLAKEFINGVRLKQIVFPNGTVTFKTGLTRIDVGDYQSKVLTDVANTQSKSLGEIQINNNNGFCKTIKLYQSYFYDAANPMGGGFGVSFPVTTTSDRYHLRLDSLKEMTCDSGLRIPPHIFSYYPELVPRKITFGQDHWGFYNGISGNNTLIPSYSLNFETILGADRDAHWPAMRGGALKKIAYPTGGFTEFEYEPHDTYGTRVSYSYIEKHSGSMGYDGNSSPYVSNKTLETGIYKLEVSNTNVGSSANVAIVNTSTSTSYSLSAAPGETKTTIISVNAGNHQFTLSKSTLGGSGCYFSIKLQATTTTTSNMMVGGLRIKSITTNDGVTSNNMVRNFTYSTGSQSSGILYSRPVYVSILRNDIVKKIGLGWAPGAYNLSVNGCANPDVSPLQPYYKSGATIMPLATSQGNHIGYQEVKVAETNNGYSIYRYYGSDIWASVNSDIVTRNISNYSCAYNIPNYPSAPLPYEPKRGELKYEGHFNNSDQVLKQVDYNYYYKIDSIGTPGYIATMTGAFWGTEYELFSYRKTRVDKTSSERDATGNYISVVNRQYYGSEYHNRMTKKVVYSSNNDSLTTNLKYAFDYLPSTCANINSAYLNCIQASDQAYNNYSLNLICTDNTWNCRWMAYQQYRWDRRNARVAFVNARRSRFIDPTNQYSTNHLTAKNNAGAEYKPILQLQDDYINGVIEEADWRNNNLLRSTFTRYDFSSSPTNKAYPNKTQVVLLSQPSATFTPSVVNGSNTSLVKDSRYLDENTYKFYQGNLTEITKKDGITNSYVWGLNNTMPIVKAVGIDHTTLLAAYNAVSGNLTTIRNQAPLSAALVYTYTYSPVIGMLSETNENKRTTSYEYDLLGRLQTVKDHNANVLKTIDYKYQSNTNQ